MTRGASNQGSRPVVTRTTLVFVRDNGRILLGMKKRGFGAGRWNGFGGKVQPGETARACAARELREEAGLDALKVAPRGRLMFSWQGKPPVIDVRVFEAIAWRGEPRESEEMRPQWFDERSVPFEAMWSDDPHWFPYLLARQRFAGSFVFDGADRVLRHEVRAVLPRPRRIRS